MLKQMRKTNIKGFSLIELMVVVAIIGILASIAVPNFQRFQRKARQSEARALLGGLYTGMETFKAEWEDYIGQFYDMGYAPGGTLLYDVGFSADDVPTNPLWMNDPGNNDNITAGTACGADIPTCTAGPTALTVGGPIANGAGLGADTFTAGAEGDIGGTNTDQWTLDQNKLFSNIQDGTF